MSSSIVNKNEADALKEMIFRRVRERSQAATDDVQADVMELARDSFVSKNNPFSQIVKKEKEEEVNEPEIGFSQKKRPENVQIKQRNDIINEQIASKAIQNNMVEARAALSSKQSFMGALNFLNSQAAVSLIRTRADKFEMVV